MSVAHPDRRSSARLEHPPTGARGGALLGAVLAALAATLLALALARPALADVGETIVLRCTHNESLSGFSQADYKKALEDLRADAEEYSACAQEIREAQLAAAAGGRGGGGSSAGGAVAAVPIAATPAEQRALAHAQRAGDEPVPLSGGQVVRPGVVRADISSAFSTLPTPVLTILAFMLAGLLAMAARTAHKRIRGRTP